MDCREAIELYRGRVSKARDYLMQVEGMGCAVTRLLEILGYGPDGLDFAGANPLIDEQETRSLEPMVREALGRCNDLEHLIRYDRKVVALGDLKLLRDLLQSVLKEM
jgi:hypothetical protein